jgi:hypothetical protein
MTPEKKAEELYIKFLRTDEGSHSVIYKETAIQCAMIAVEEIIEATKFTVYNPEYQGVIYDKYWKEVKLEIQKL